MSVNQLFSSRLLKFLVAGFVLLLLNSSYLAAYGDPSVFYIANMMLHFALGLLLTGVFLAFLRQRWAQFQALLKGASLLLLLCAFAGCGMLLFSAIVPFTGPVKPPRWPGIAHTIVGTLGTIALAIAALRFRLPDSIYGRTVRLASVAVVIGLCIPFAMASYQKHQRRTRDYIVNPGGAPLSMEGEEPGRKVLSGHHRPIPMSTG